MLLKARFRILIFTTLAMLCLAGFHNPEETYPQNYFTKPVDRELLLSGTFGELRPNHFHAGLDIKSRDGSVGEDIFASASGFISRISVQSGGYGNAVYIDHPNGYTTVYAHLDHFTDEVVAYVRKMQYELTRFEVNLYPKPDQFRVAKGDRIGYLGNSGSSSGPHVHFEIRKTAGQIPINPLLFGIRVRDDRHPDMKSLKVYHLDTQLQTHEDHTITPTYLSSGQYTLRDTLIEEASRVGFGLKVFDQMNGASNQNGIYALDILVDGTLQYAFSLTRIPFGQTRYLNAHIDYEAKAANQGYYHRCFRLPGNALDIYREAEEKGVIELPEHTVRHVTIRARDESGNQSELSFYIKRGAEGTQVDAVAADVHVNYLESQQIRVAGLLAGFEPHTFYQNVSINCSLDSTERKDLFAPVHRISPAYTPLHRYYDLTITSSGLPERLRSKAFLAQILPGGRLVSWGGIAHGDHIYAPVRELGSFSVAVDTLAPEIIPITFRSNMRGTSRMRFRIEDKQAVTGQADGLFYEATVDGQWILMEYEGKRAMLTHWFDGRIGPGTHELKLIVRDDRGNTRTLVREFTL